jgi:hypothetical protein
MDWRGKIRYLAHRKEHKDAQDPYFYDIRIWEYSWEMGEIDNLIKSYSWLPMSYQQFLHDYDSPSIAFCRFFGSKKAVGYPAEEKIIEYADRLGEQYFPFGCYADGSVFLLDRQGRIRWWDKYDYDFEQEPKILTNTFEEFVDDCLLGRRYGEFSSTDDDNRFYKLLKDQGWT